MRNAEPRRTIADNLFPHTSGQLQVMMAKFGDIQIEDTLRILLIRTKNEDGEPDTYSLKFEVLEVYDED